MTTKEIQKLFRKVKNKNEFYELRQVIKYCVLEYNRISINANIHHLVDEYEFLSNCNYNSIFYFYKNMFHEHCINN